MYEVLTSKNILLEYQDLDKSNYQDYLYNMLLSCKRVNCEIFEKTKDKTVLENICEIENLILSQINKPINIKNIGKITERVLEYHWLLEELGNV